MPNKLGSRGPHRQGTAAQYESRIVPITFTVPEEIKVFIQERAAKAGISFNQIAREFMILAYETVKTAEKI